MPAMSIITMAMRKNWRRIAQTLCPRPWWTTAPPTAQAEKRNPTNPCKSTRTILLWITVNNQMMATHWKWRRPCVWWTNWHVTIMWVHIFHFFFLLHRPPNGILYDSFILVISVSASISIDQRDGSGTQQKLHGYIEIGWRELHGRG